MFCLRIAVIFFKQPRFFFLLCQFITTLTETHARCSRDYFPFNIHLVSPSPIMGVSYITLAFMQAAFLGTFYFIFPLLIYEAREVTFFVSVRALYNLHPRFSKSHFFEQLWFRKSICHSFSQLTFRKIVRLYRVF